MVMSDRDKAQDSYRPHIIKIIFVAEAPPDNEARYFYYQSVPTADGLWLFSMRCLFPRSYGEMPAKKLRAIKHQTLRRFKDSGFIMLDACLDPIPATTRPNQRVKIIWINKEDLCRRLKSLHEDAIKKGVQPPVGIILIKSTVYNALNEYLLNDCGIPVLNKGVMVPFPGSGNQKRFCEALHKVFEANNIPWPE
jgi:hypothetical protein